LKLVVPARAKLNLDLQVIGRRADGFHDLHSTFQAIDLHDLIAIEPASHTRMQVEGFDVDAEENSVIRALHAVEESAGRALPTEIRLVKRIPPGSGMGGASSDAAATLKVLSQMFNLTLDLKAIAAQLGSDVPFFLHGGRARAEGRGDRLLALESTRMWFAIAWPGFGLSTGDVYEAWDQVGGEGPNELRRAAELADPRLKAFAEDLGPGWQMTGSGSAFFKSVSTEQDANHATRQLECWTAVASSVPAWG
jgi:4-diphosphocytidyl-2-C-methyl-D-erythritol kinase